MILVVFGLMMSGQFLHSFYPQSNKASFLLGKLLFSLALVCAPLSMSVAKAETAHAKGAVSVRSFSPNSGIGGTRVMIVGKGFSSDNLKVFIGKEEATVISRSAERLVVQVPKGSKSGKVSVESGGVRAKSRETFTVANPAPTISKVSPTKATPGSRVRIEGSNLKNTKVYFRDLPVNIDGRGKGWLDVTVPNSAKESGSFRLAGPHGEATTAMVAISLLPTVKRVWPRLASPGAEVALLGESFKAGDKVEIGNVQAHILEINAKKIRFQVPKTSRLRGTTRITVVRNSKRYDVGTVVIPKKLAITDLSYKSVAIGDTLSVYGNDLTEKTRVYFGKYPLVVESASKDGKELTVRIPEIPKGVNWLRIKDGTQKTRSPYQLQITEPVEADTDR